MFSTPLICCSIGVTTVDATTSALAPGYWPETFMMGGAISGYCAIGSREKETPPRTRKTIDTTAAKIGRSMKKCEIRIQFALASLQLAANPRAKPPVPLVGLPQVACVDCRDSAVTCRLIAGSSSSGFVAAFGRGSGRIGDLRSEERRVGKEGRSRGSP